MDRTAASLVLYLTYRLLQNMVPECIRKCSTIGPSASAGKKGNAPTIRMTPISKTTNSGVLTGKEPTEGGTIFLAARLPAMPIIGMIIRKRPTSMASPSVVLYQIVLTLKPPNAEPLLPVAD